MNRRRDLTIGLGLLLLIALRPAAAFEFNGRHWADMPVPYHINPTDCPVLDDGVDVVEIVRRAAANWSDPACASVQFEFVGLTDATWAADGLNTIYCVAENWDLGQGAAGAALWIPTGEGEPYELDLALNTDEYNWKLGGGSAIQNLNLDPVAVVTHELGHWLGMSHSVAPFATMYYASLPNGLGASLAGDDVAGICTLYPSGQDLCQSDADCPDCHRCDEIAGIPVCEEILDPPGAFCSKDHIYCEDMCWVSFQECAQACLFTNMSYSEGYCAPLCDEAAPDCPPDFTCTHVTSVDVWVCQSETPALDGGVDRDGCGGLLPNDGGDGSDADSPDAGSDADDAGSDGAAGDGDPIPDGGDQADRDEAGAGCACGQREAGPIWLLAPLLVIARWRRRNLTR